MEGEVPKNRLNEELEQRLKEYESLFGTEGNADSATKKLKEKGLSCGLKDTKLRSVVWKVFLEVLPPYVSVSEWPERIQKSREEYEALIKKYCIDPHKLEETNGVFDPLSQDENSPWNKYFQNEELKKDIYRDLERTYPEQEFFQTEETQHNLCRALLVYSRDHPECGYRQGMHELLAPMYYVVHTEATAFAKMIAEHTDDAIASRMSAKELRVILDPKFIEHDSYSLFSALMVNAEEFFVQSKVPIAPSGAAQSPQEQHQEHLTPVVTRCRKIHHLLLKQKDPMLYEHLVECHIEPQLYAMRWLRLLFGREFHLQDLLVLWDAIFAYGRSLALADYIAVAMLIYIRQQLLDMDEVTAMKRLLKYPPVEDITLFITKAVELSTPKRVAPAPAPAPAPVPVQPTTTRQSVNSAASNHHQPRQQQSAGHQIRGVFDILAKAVAGSDGRSQRVQQQQHPQQHVPQQAPAPVVKADDAELNKLREQLRTMEDERQHAAARLDRVIYCLQQELISTPQLAENSAIVNALAELKQLTAVFSGIVDPSMEPNPNPPVSNADPLGATTTAASN